MRKSIKFFIAATGVLLVILGILFVANPAGGIFSMAVMLGLFVLFSGIFQLLFVLNAQHLIPNSGTRVLSAVFQIVLGCFLLSHKLFVGASLPIIFAVWVLAEGIIGAVKAFDYKQVDYKYWWCILLLGICGAVLGVLGLANLGAAAKTLSVLVGIAIIIEGLSYFVMLGGIKRFEKRVKEVKEGVSNFLS